MSAPTTQVGRTDRMLASMHEAGHAVACLEYRVAMLELVIQPALLADSCAGYVDFRDGDLNKRLADPRVDAVVSLAGGEAERIFRVRYDMGTPDESRWETDLGYAARACSRGNLRVADMQIVAHRLVQRRWSEVFAIGRMLERRKVLRQAAIRRAAKDGLKAAR